jgi:hypothetical protein
MIDSTGLRVHSGNLSGSSPPKRRAWRKLHIVVNADTNEILASALTTHRAGDAAQVPVLLSQIDDPLASAMADGAYDSSSVYAAVEAHGSGPPPQTLIPPRQDAPTRSGANISSQRNATVRAIGAAGRRRWAHDSGYTRRSLVETAMWRYKAIIGGSMRSRTMASVAEDRGCACVHDFEQNDPARDAGWLLHRVKGTLQRRDRLVFEPCNKASPMLMGASSTLWCRRIGHWEADGN